MKPVDYSLKLMSYIKVLKISVQKESLQIEDVKTYVFKCINEIPKNIFKIMTLKFIKKDYPENTQKYLVMILLNFNLKKQNGFLI